MPGQTPKGKPFESGSVFIREDLSREYDSESIAVVNATNSFIFYPPGTPFTGVAQTAQDITAGGTGALTGADSLILDGIWVPPSSTWKCAVIKRPAGVVVNANALPTVVNGISYTNGGLTNMLTRLAFVFRYEPLRWLQQNQ